jgi:hypothetical protein
MKSMFIINNDILKVKLFLRSFLQFRHCTLAKGRFERGRCSMVDQAVEESTSKDLAVRDFELSRCSEWTRGEGPTILLRCARFVLAFVRKAGSDRFFGSRSKPLWRSRILHQSVQLTTNASTFGCNLFACFLPEHDHKANEFEGTEQAVIILPVDNDIII